MSAFGIQPVNRNPRVPQVWSDEAFKAQGLQNATMAQQPGDFSQSLANIYGSQAGAMGAGMGAYGQAMAGMPGAQAGLYQAYMGNLANLQSNRMSQMGQAEMARQVGLSNLGTAGMSAYGQMMGGAMGAQAANSGAYLKALSDMNMANQQSLAQYGVGRDSSLASTAANAASFGGAMGNAYGNMASQLAASRANAAGQLGQSFGSTVTGLGNAASSLGGQLAGAGSNLFGTLGTAAGGVGQGAANAFGNLYGTLGNAAGGISQAATSGISNLQAALGNAAGNVGSSASQSMGNMFGNMSNAAGGIGASANNAIGGIYNTVGNAFGQAGSAFGNAQGGLAGTAANAAANFGGQATTARGGLLSSLANTDLGAYNTANNFTRDMAKLGLARELGTGQLNVSSQVATAMPFVAGGLGSALGGLAAGAGGMAAGGSGVSLSAGDQPLGSSFASGGIGGGVGGGVGGVGVGGSTGGGQTVPSIPPTNFFGQGREWFQDPQSALPWYSQSEFGADRMSELDARVMRGIADRANDGAMAIGATADATFGNLQNTGLYGADSVRSTAGDAYGALAGLAGAGSSGISGVAGQSLGAIDSAGQRGVSGIQDAANAGLISLGDLGRAGGAGITSASSDAYGQLGQMGAQGRGIIDRAGAEGYGALSGLRGDTRNMFSGLSDATFSGLDADAAMGRRGMMETADSTYGAINDARRGIVDSPVLASLLSSAQAGRDQLERSSLATIGGVRDMAREGGGVLSNMLAGGFGQVNAGMNQFYNNLGPFDSSPYDTALRQGSRDLRDTGRAMTGALDGYMRAVDSSGRDAQAGVRDLFDDSLGQTGYFDTPADTVRKEREAEMLRRQNRLEDPVLKREEERLKRVRALDWAEEAAKWQAEDRAREDALPLNVTAPRIPVDPRMYAGWTPGQIAMAHGYRWDDRAQTWLPPASRAEVHRHREFLANQGFY